MSLIANLLPQKTNFDFIGKHWIGFAISALITISTIFLVTTRGLNFGIDFSGGILIEARTAEAADLSIWRKALDIEEFGEVSLQNFSADGRDIMIRLQSKGQDQAAVVEKIKIIISTIAGSTVEYRKIDYVGEQVGSEFKKSGFIALGLSLFAMLVYIWLRFDWQFGIGGVLALLHDAIATIGFFALTRIEFNLTSVAAILTIIGYSINDSVVIYDRIRENMRKFKKLSLGGIINLSVNETLSRTILTGGTVILSVIGLIVFGGDALSGFSYAMLFGVIIGTYSSVYISAPVLLYTGVTTDSPQNIEQA